MANEIMKKTINVPKEIDIFQSTAYKNLPAEKQVEIAQYMARKNVDLTMEQKQYLLEHMSSDHDTTAYLNFLDDQNRIDANAKGVTMTYNSYETKTPTGRISSKTTHASASTGCLLPVLGALAVIVIAAVI